MATLSIRFPDSVHDAVKIAARNDDTSINQFVTSAVIEKLTALDTEQYIEKRAANGSLAKFQAVLAKVPNTPAREDDAIE